MRTLITLLACGVSVSAADFLAAAQTNGFRASLYFTDHQVFGARTNGFGLPVFTQISKVKRGTWFYPAVVFSGPGLQSDGTADIIYGLVVRKPDGSMLQELEGMVVTRARFSRADKASHLARDAQGICIKPGDPAGTYTVNVNIKDKVRRMVLNLEGQFTIEK